jgi:hypothetical protein
MIFGFGKNREAAGVSQEIEKQAGSGFAREAENKNGENQVNRAADSTKTLLERVRSDGPLARAFLIGAMFVALSTPQEAMATGPHDQVDSLNILIREMGVKIRKLEAEQERLERKQGKYDQVHPLRVSHTKFELGQVNAELRSAVAGKERLVFRKGKVGDKITKVHKRRGERLEKHGKSPLEIYRFANEHAKAYYISNDFRYQNRSWIVTGVDGEDKFIDIGYEFDIWNSLVKGNKLTTIFLKNDGSYYGIVFENGMYINEGPCDDKGNLR